ncbi:hypothetical protein HT102_14940 [Hoyosella sp. G463]|uniref:Uncharacterized protein n=1 Tax=Lolliginicoccus lacisalsi TaxID=2742202 RepID=A0A927PMB3_9ACTN|nr:hypothetical protein [Lolliginicoccus lacisalsi]MBD8507783.1 hypothetical protein [Lolliginicoccus lacisalsi]
MYWPRAAPPRSGQDPVAALARLRGDADAVRCSHVAVHPVTILGAGADRIRALLEEPGTAARLLLALPSLAELDALPAPIEPAASELHRMLEQGLLDGVILTGIGTVDSLAEASQRLRALVGERGLVLVQAPMPLPRSGGPALPASIDGTVAVELTRTTAGVLAGHNGRARTLAKHYVPRSEFHLMRAHVARNWPRTLIPAGGTPQARLIDALGPGSPIITGQPRTLGTLLSAALALRAERPEVFVGGEYEPLQATGPRQTHVVGFARGRAHSLPEAICVVLRSLNHDIRADIDDDPEEWSRTLIRFPPGTWHDVTTDRTIYCAPDDPGVSITDALPRDGMALYVRGGEPQPPPRELHPRAS